METERRLLLAIVLMIVAIVAANVLFPPPPPPPATEAPETREPPAEVREPPAVAERVPERPPAREEPRAAAIEEELAAAAGEEPEEEEPAAAERLEAPPPPADTIVVRSPLYEYRFTTRGAALLGARLLRYESYAPGAPAGSRVELLRPGDRIFGYRVAVGRDTLDLREREFRPSDTSLELGEGAADSLTFRHELAGGRLAFAVTYRFRGDGYLMEVVGRFEGLGERGYGVLTSLGSGLQTNEANPSEDYGQLAYVVHERAGGYRSEKLSDVDADERKAVAGAPFRWVAVKNKYFLVALVTEPSGPGFGGLLVSGLPEERAARMEATLPVPAGEPAFVLRAYVGPQAYGRMAAVGQDLQNVNPYGWRWLRPVIRPLVGLIMTVLVWMHETFALAYGWVLIVFGVLMRVVLFPLYQKSMRAQLAQMQVQPLMKEIQAKYKDEPQKLQQEMVKLYKEHNINPLAGCLPMLIPFPVLITLFFVFQNTIEFRGVPFLWLPDLSLKDPFYIIPLLMGLSMFLLNWIGQRGVEQNAQMKMISYGLPIVFTFLFMNFPSGLNLYYATSNFASLPQQIYLSRERRKARAGAPPAGISGEVSREGA